MNKVEVLEKDTVWDLRKDLKAFAEDYEIINISLTTRETRMGTSSFVASVLYKD